MPLTPQDFVSKRKCAEARERQSAQEYFLDLCQLVGRDSPMQSDPTGTRFAFEMGAAKTSGGTGWADVAKLGYFGWEYKRFIGICRDSVHGCHGFHRFTRKSL
jgi:hypothetical protein